MRKISKKEREEDLRIMNKITSKSKFTKKDINELSEKIKRAIAKKFSSLK